MTGTSQAGDTLRPYADGSRIKHKLTGRAGIVLTRTIENPPRYLTLMEGDRTEGLALHHEIEGAVAEARPTFNSASFSTMTPLPFSFSKLNDFLANPFGLAKPDVTTSAIMWRDGAGGVLSECGKFGVKQIRGLWYGADFARGQVSYGLKTEDRAREWCEARKAGNLSQPATNIFPGMTRPTPPTPPTPPATEVATEKASKPLKWRQIHISGSLPFKLSECGLFMIEKRSCGHWTAHEFYPTDNNPKDSPHFHYEKTAEQWCESRANGTDEPKPYQGIDDTRNAEADTDDKPAPAETQLDGQTVGPIEPPKPPALEWHAKPNADGWLYENVGLFRTPRFKIGSYYRDVPAPVVVPLDLRATSQDIRYGPGGTVEQCKEWCAKRAEFDVIYGANGAETLQPKSEIPF